MSQCLDWHIAASSINMRMCVVQIYRVRNLIPLLLILRGRCAWDKSWKQVKFCVGDWDNVFWRGTSRGVCIVVSHITWRNCILVWRQLHTVFCRPKCDYMTVEWKSGRIVSASLRWRYIIRVRSAIASCDMFSVFRLRRRCVDGCSTYESSPALTSTSLVCYGWRLNHSQVAIAAVCWWWMMKCPWRHVCATVNFGTLSSALTTMGRSGAPSRQAAC